METLKSQTPPQTQLPYNLRFAPYFKDQQALAEAQHEARDIGGITRPECIELVRQEFGRIALGQALDPIIITGNCSRQIRLLEPIQHIAEEIRMQLDIVRTVLPEALYINRGANQNFKPRSSEYEALPNGTEILSYFGDGINSPEPTKGSREPKPAKLVEAAIQAMAIQDFFEATDDHLITAHEALLPEYESCFMVEMKRKQYLLSGELPWIGERTRSLEGPQVEMLTGIVNPVGVKIGPKATEDDIRGLNEVLNPRNEPGKIMFTLRIGVDKLPKVLKIVKAIEEYAPSALIVSDPMHGNTKNAGNGQKTRHIQDICREIRAVFSACEAVGLRLHGLHLEASGREDAKECINGPEETPASKPVLDPELNNTQLREILKTYASLIH